MWLDIKILYRNNLAASLSYDILPEFKHNNPSNRKPKKERKIIFKLYIIAEPMEIL